MTRRDEKGDSIRMGNGGEWGGSCEVQETQAVQGEEERTEKGRQLRSAAGGKGSRHRLIILLGPPRALQERRRVRLPMCKQQM